MNCTFCNRKTDEKEAMVCDDPHCNQIICLDCTDYAFLCTSCCEQTYCIRCNKNEFTSCFNCGVDICSNNCQVDCCYCEHKACTTCVDENWRYCNKCGAVSCDDCSDSLFFHFDDEVCKRCIKI